MFESNFSKALGFSSLAQNSIYQMLFVLMPKCNFKNHNIIHCVALPCSFSARCQEKHIASTLWALESHWREFIQRRGRSCNPNQLGIPSCRVREQAAEQQPVLQPRPMGPVWWIKGTGSSWSKDSQPKQQTVQQECRQLVWARKKVHEKTSVSICWICCCNEHYQMQWHL